MARYIGLAGGGVRPSVVFTTDLRSTFGSRPLQRKASEHSTLICIARPSQIAVQITPQGALLVFETLI